MKKIFLAALLLFSTHFTIFNADAAGIGTWKAYLAYHDVSDVVKVGNTLYVLASNGLYAYNENDGSITTYDKVNGLSDCEISMIAWNNSAKRLVIVYSNQNIDLLSANGEITNVGDIYNFTTTDNKTINSIMMSGRYAYLSTGFGIIKLNVADAEISNTYNLGFNVNWSSVSNNMLHAYSTSDGHYQASLSANLLDKGNWSRVGDYIAETKENKEELLAKARTLIPGGPKYNYFGFMKFYKGRLYTCGGGYTVTQDLMRPGSIQVMNNDTWQIYEDNLSEKTGAQYVDLNCLDIDPKNENHVFAGGRTGLYEFNNGQFTQLHTYDNSSLASTFQTDKNYVLVQGLKFNSNGDLWVINSLNNDQNLLKYSAQKEWSSFYKENLKALANMSKLYFDNSGLLWFVNDNWQKPSFYVYQESTDAMNSFTSFVNEDGTTIAVNNVRCVDEDNNHNIWLGTDMGPIYLLRSDITKTNPAVQQYKVPRNDGTNLADYLLSGVDISCMAIDGAGRKWFGTNGNGVYLISQDNNTQEQHFLSSNSNLLSNNIESIAINPSTGEVFFGTDKGLCSYMSDATATVSEMGKEATYAYPNPVKPNYSGPITIKGLTYNADIKIVTSNGVLVNEGKSTGGSYVWNGNDLNGNPVASGVYMVQVATQEGEKGTVCKIAIVR